MFLLDPGVVIRPWKTGLSLVFLLVVSSQLVHAALAMDPTGYIPGSAGFAMGRCCSETTGTVCGSEGCVVSDTCLEAPYTTCAGDSGNADGLVSGAGPTYPPPFTACDMSSPHLRIESSYDPASGKYTRSNALLKWDTSNLGRMGATVTSASLQVVTGKLNCSPDGASISADDLNISADWYNWDQGVSGCDQSDYTAGLEVTAIPGRPLKQIGCYQVIVFDLVNIDNINLTGTTYLRLNVTPDRAPTGTNAIEFSAVEETYVAPFLFVKYVEARGGAGAARFAAGGYR